MCHYGSLYDSDQIAMFVLSDDDRSASHYHNGWETDEFQQRTSLSDLDTGEHNADTAF